MADPENMNCPAMFDLTPTPRLLLNVEEIDERERENFEEDYFVVCEAM
jgi:hypothetical protein